MKQLSAVTFLLLAACGLTAEQQRLLLIQDAEDVLAVLERHQDPEVARVAADLRLVVAALEDAEGDPLAALEALLPDLGSGLVRAGLSPVEAEALLVAVRSGIRRMRAAATG